MTVTAPAVERLYTRNECLADTVIHTVGVIFAIYAVCWLLWNVAGLPAKASITLYCAGLLAMICASAAYNLIPAPHPSKRILRRLDHSAIFIMIAATYTPFAANRLPSPAGEIILGAIWFCAALGIGFKLLFPGRFELVGAGFCVAMGWMILAVIEPLRSSLVATDFWLLIGGGLVYMTGVAFYLSERIPFHKAIWHAFVLAAAIMQFVAIAMEFT